MHSSPSIIILWASRFRDATVHDRSLRPEPRQSFATSARTAPWHVGCWTGGEMSELKHAVRALLKSPAFSLVAVLSIAVGIGANTSLFSVYDRLVLNPVTIPNSGSLVAIWTSNASLNFNAPALSWPRYEEIRDHARSFASVGISAFDNF